MNILIVIPARGGSKGIPRKNLRPLNGKPLLYYSITNALNSSFNADVVVSTDDDEIAYFAGKIGAEVHKRDPSLADDKSTLDPVIYDAYSAIKKQKKKEYDLIITLQPTSPLLSVYSLDKAISMMNENQQIDTILSAVNDTHLTWRQENEKFAPNYLARVNRQFLPPVYKETGGFLITRSSVISHQTRIGKNVELFIVPSKESIDIDSFEDWQLCEYHLSRKNILFRVSGYPEIGLGHVYNCLILASEILKHRVYFLTDKRSELAYEKIKSSNYEIYSQSHENIIEDIESLSPDIVINDCLDTDISYMKALKDKKFSVINFEDLGPGAVYSDLVVNAIYPEKEKYQNHYYGPAYFCARDEFIFSEPITVNLKVDRVLLTFGGVDPNNLTYKVLEAIYGHCCSSDIQLDVVLGLGYRNHETLTSFKNANIIKDVKNISDYMRNADIVFSSAGRTTYELALLGTPSIILAQNEREMTHFFADESNGFRNLGLGSTVNSKSILEAFIELSGNYNERVFMNKLMLKNKIREGKKNVLSLINKIAEQ